MDLSASPSSRPGPTDLPRPVPTVLDLDAAEALGDHDERRHRAVAVALIALAPIAGVDPDSWAPQVSLCRFAAGAVVVALGGSLDRMALETLHGVTEVLDTLAADELVVDMSCAVVCDAAVARVVARWRIRRLTAGARVELRGTPSALRAELGQHPTSF